MKHVVVHEEWCLGCHLCEYNCAYANSGIKGMAKALKGKRVFPRIRVEDGNGDGKNNITFAVSCRHCHDPICAKSCISGALTVRDGAVTIDRSRCVGCYTCILVCPYGAIYTDGEGAVIKCELCLSNQAGSPACVAGCPNRALTLEETD